MNKKLLSAMLVSFLLIMNVVSARELPAQGVYEMEQATLIDKLLCKVGLKDCFNTNEGVMIVKIPDASIITQQAILSAGLKAADTESIFYPSYTTRDFKKGTKVGFCAMVKFEDVEGRCEGTRFHTGIAGFTLDGQRFTTNFNVDKKVGDVDRYCYVLALNEDMVYEKVDFRAGCKSGTRIANQGELYVRYLATVTEAGKSCEIGWECAGDSIRYVNADCGRQDARSCPQSSLACSGSYPDAKCVPRKKPIVEVPTGSATINGVCEFGETCADIDCAKTKECLPVETDKTKDLDDESVMKKSFWQNYSETIIFSSVILLVLIVVVIIRVRRRG